MMKLGTGALLLLTLLVALTMPLWLPLITMPLDFGTQPANGESLFIEGTLTEANKVKFTSLSNIFSNKDAETYVVRIEKRNQHGEKIAFQYYAAIAGNVRRQLNREIKFEYKPATPRMISIINGGFDNPFPQIYSHGDEIYVAHLGRAVYGKIVLPTRD